MQRSMDTNLETSLELADAVARRWHPSTRIVAAKRAPDLDHGSAEIAQPLPARLV